MRETRQGPLNLLEFVSIENQQFLTTLVNCRYEFDLFANLDVFYREAITNREGTERNAVLFQLLFFTHYHLLFATACFMRCHWAEAFASARSAIDASLIAAQIIDDRDSQLAYLNREKPFDKLVRHYRNLVRDGKPLPHRHIPFLIKRHDFCSQFAAHADIDSFAHRLELTDKPRRTLLVQYFQMPKEPAELQANMLVLVMDFATVLDVFSDFLVDEGAVLPPAWRERLRKLGSTIEMRIADLVGSK